MNELKSIVLEQEQLFLGLIPTFWDVNFYNHSYQKIVDFLKANGFKDIFPKALEWKVGRDNPESFCYYDTLDCSYSVKPLYIGGSIYTENDLTYYSCSVSTFELWCIDVFRIKLAYDIHKFEFLVSYHVPDDLEASFLDFISNP
ncbi:hypothetical protein DHW03_18145 [Pedobacter yonginense]|uniref:Uncharacterized protein n=1 Tax=Pedobacter yonginense TaxID=651869 RepID=A0A317EHB2_9SPHI|nr:hypothetical protein [Pedobacter yonginense]PWS25974.1 hypothetical protein DHW03_18145 [Pedobacter yonginense]